MGDEQNFLEMILGGHLRQPGQANRSKAFPLLLGGWTPSNSTQLPLEDWRLLHYSQVNYRLPLKTLISKAERLAFLDILKTFSTI